MPVFWNNSFKGHRPVGTSAVVVAKNKTTAKKMLESALKEMGLSQKVQLGKVVKLATHEPITIILQDGNY